MATTGGPWRERVPEQLRRLVDLPLSLTRRAADLRGFHFGAVRAVERGDPL